MSVKNLMNGSYLYWEFEGYFGIAGCLEFFKLPNTFKHQCFVPYLFGSDFEVHLSIKMA